MSYGDEKAPVRDVEAGSAPSITSTEIAAHVGVRNIEATHKVFGKYSKWCLFISLGLAAYIYSLDGTTTYNYLAFAASYLGGHSLISTIQVAQAIIVAVGKPVIAKIADVKSRPIAYVLVLIFYIVGYIVIASAKNVGTIAGGIVIYAIGYTGLQLLTQIIIADITVLKWRGLVSSLMSLPFIINAFVGSNISTAVLEGSAGWRWGYGMFAILVPATLSPLIVTLIWAERKAKKQGLIKDDGEKKPVLQSMLDTANKLDVVGLFLLGACVALILLPMTLSRVLGKGWQSPSMIATICVGGALIPVYLIWEAKFTKYPVIPRRFLLNKTVVIACLIGALDFVSFYISYAYLYSFVIVVKPWSLKNATYFIQCQTVTLTVFGIVGGALMRYLRRYKPILIGGLAIRLLGTGLMIHSRGANASDAEIVWSQILQGMGGGMAAVSSQVAAQASVPHIDTASVTAIVLLITEIGGAVGNAIAGAVWTSLMPDQLAKHLPMLDQATRDQLFGSIVAVSAEPRGHPIREAVILAYDNVMLKLCIAACVFAVPPLLLSLLMPNWYLGDFQNAVEQTDLAGSVVGGDESSERGVGEKGDGSSEKGGVGEKGDGSSERGVVAQQVGQGQTQPGSNAVAAQ
ncbi:ferrichrome-type siderophore transporter [Coprinopsis cinerea okayama7|uniref:Ferrichrome-type siderophore transporter n=1 Tax=Coprinopsis cinerea (strain Okayama-7 / 130 / ATCC MYA-4618 / FGSC 9003) TaxID=240176 RepID=A8MZS5_COPC7|nr:ferrichrome-type siderophore transporter [Coprinopsis cinerea okayama7\|eukprot:XP_001828137.1 ferrichrome-type siderophore transporter [Coprinopsis cinerea okayama7\